MLILLEVEVQVQEEMMMMLVQELVQVPLPEGHRSPQQVKGQS